MWNSGNRLQQEIIKKICGKILAHKLQPGHPLNVSQLSQELNLSRTPVTTALGIMADEGLVSRTGSRGYSVTRWNRARVAAVEGLLAAENVDLYMRIAEDRVAGALPEEVSEALLLRRYSTDRPTLLRALQELELDGLCRSKPGRGWTFEPALNSASAYHESYNFRKLIFPRCFFEPTYRFNKAGADACRRRHAELRSIASPTRRAIADCNAEFHETLAAMSGNRFVLSAAKSQNRIRRVLEYAYNWQLDSVRLEEIYRSHMEILDLLEAGEIEAASHAYWRHLDEAAKRSPPPPASTTEAPASRRRK